MGDARAITLGVVAVAAIAAIAGGAGKGSSSTSSADVVGDLPRPASTVSSSGPCTGLDTVTTTGGGEYSQYPVSASNSLGCTMRPGDAGEAVSTLQRALASCSKAPVRVTGSYDARTRRAVTALGGAGGVYGPTVASRMTWPWFSAAGRAFTGRCSAAETSS